MKWGNLIPWRAKQQHRDTGWMSPVDQFHTEVDRLFDRFFSDDWEFPVMRTGWDTWSPSLDLTETDHEITIRAELPGVDPKDLDISISGDVLTISGEKKETTEKKEKGLYHSECRYGSFRRSLTLPATVHEDDISADYKNGVLTITMKKAVDTNVKRIPVKAS